jgi:hypothetical protein
VCQPILPTPARTAAGLMCRRRMLSCQRGFPLRFANTQSQGSRCRLRCQCALSASARLGSMGRGNREASVFVSPTRPWTTLRLLRQRQRSKPLLNLDRLDFVGGKKSASLIVFRKQPFYFRTEARVRAAFLEERQAASWLLLQGSLEQRLDCFPVLWSRSHKSPRLLLAEPPLTAPMLGPPF